MCTIGEHVQHTMKIEATGKRELYFPFSSLTRTANATAATLPMTIPAIAPALSPPPPLLLLPLAVAEPEPADPVPAEGAAVGPQLVPGRRLVGLIVWPFFVGADVVGRGDGLLVG
jgi:hypothetical protein